MIDLLRFARDLATDLLRWHVKLVAENALLRQHLIVAERKIVGRPRWKPCERYAMAPPHASHQHGGPQPYSCSLPRYSAGIASGFAGSGGTEPGGFGRRPTPCAALIREMATQILGGRVERIPTGEPLDAADRISSQHGSFMLR